MQSGSFMARVAPGAGCRGRGGRSAGAARARRGPGRRAAAAPAGSAAPTRSGRSRPSAAARGRMRFPSSSWGNCRAGIRECHKNLGRF
ncbi:MAG TPA: hypothetical protein DCM68_00320 [Verrucomicrobia bacterium]|nr:hypothetical protein [Verrucomicrobiota bacterium]